jgi:Uma2 family endonuclease
MEGRSFGPEISLELLPSNTVPEIREKQALYFEAGIQEVWICGPDGKLRFYVAPGHQVETSLLCLGFPKEVS